MRDRVAEIRARLGDAHIQTPYYEEVEAGDRLGLFWGVRSVFHPLFEQLDLDDVVEIACGHGRHAAQIIDKVGSLTLVDINRSNIDACQVRFRAKPRVRYVVNSGSDLSALQSGAYSAVYSYDSMVHFEASDVIAYVGEIARVLRPGGRALLHYSNTQNNPQGTYADDPRWRAFFSEPMMRHFGSRVGLMPIASQVISWPPPPIVTGTADADAVTLFEKVPDEGRP